MHRLMIFCVTVAVSATMTSLGTCEERYQPNWDSLSKHAEPEWFRDAKFGIYTHWGPVTVGAENASRGRVQWYGMSMYQPSDAAFEFHRKTFGDQHEFGYKEVISLFRPIKFDAQQWAKLFAASGAKFAGPVVIHHDNFAMWDSKLTRWDSQDNGLHRDFTGELSRAIREQNMKFIATFHHSFSWRYFEPSHNYDGANPEFADLYCEGHKKGDPPTKNYHDLWLGKVNEVVQKYEPDLIWFDFGLGHDITPEYQRRMFADYYNWADRNKRDVCVAHKHWDIHKHTGLIDFERGRLDYLPTFPWLTDTSVGPWFHQKSSEFKTVDQLVDVLIDIVSKNGCMLLNVGPNTEGEIPDQATVLLRGIGDWLHVNGEAIYATRPWLVYGEGPTQMAKSGGFSESKDFAYTHRDVRYTVSKDGKALYAIIMRWPGEKLTLESLQVTALDGQGRVELLGSEAGVAFEVLPGGQLELRTPAEAAAELRDAPAVVFKLTGFSLALHSDARFNLPDSVQVPLEKVTLDGAQVRLQDNGGRPNIGAWDRADELCHWLVRIPRAGDYMMRGEFSSAYGPSALKISIGSQQHECQVPKTDGWFQPTFVRGGDFSFPAPGVYHLILSPANAKKWKAVNVWQLQFAPKK